MSMNWLQRLSSYGSTKASILPISYHQTYTLTYQPQMNYQQLQQTGMSMPTAQGRKAKQPTQPTDTTISSLLDSVRKQVRQHQRWWLNPMFIPQSSSWGLIPNQLTRSVNTVLPMLDGSCKVTASSGLKNNLRLKRRSNACLRQSSCLVLQVPGRTPVARHTHQALCLDSGEHKSAGKPLEETLLVFYQSQKVRPELD